MKGNQLRRHLVAIPVLLLGATNVAAESPTVHVEYRARVDEPGGLRYVLAEGTMSGTVRGDATYTIPVQIHYPAEGGNGTVVLELTNSALLFCHLGARDDRVGARRSDADDIDELEAMQVNFGWAGAREYLLRNGFTHMAIQHSKMVTDFMGGAPPEGRTRRRLCYGRIERASDGYEIVRDAARWLAAPGALTGDAAPVPAHDHVIAYGLSGTGYFLRDYLIRGENAGGEIDGFFVHAAGSKCLALIDAKVGSPRVYHWSTCPGPPPTNGAKVLAVDAQSDLEFNDGALAREAAVDDPDYVRWEVAGAPHVPVFAIDLTRIGAPHQNPMDWSPIWRSAFHYLDRWVRHDTAPPTAPPIKGRMVSTENGDTWKCDLDADGNALGGIRLPPIEAPMGVYTGFDFSWLDPAVSQGHRYAMVFAYGGRFERFSDETLAERYPTEADYRKSFEAAARRAFDAGYILEEDLRRYTAAPPPSDPGPVVETSSGKVRGVIDGEVMSFKGIPFAAPPVGDLRWRAPQLPAPWEGVRDALEAGPICVQGGDGQFSGSEDCLYLNVWARRKRDDGLCPVLFWIHGGGFRAGGTIDLREEGSTLAREGIVVVTANYRLGRIGFFAYPALTAENADGGRLANYGLMDQIAALEWVRDNIASFGGDPDNVTIAGESAGGIAVNHLMTTQLTRGLFVRAIVQSGSARDNELLPFRLLGEERPGRRSAEWVGLRFAHGQGIEGSGADVLTALRALPASVVADGLDMMTREEHSFGGPIGDGVVVPDHYEAIYRAGREHPLPLIVGATDADGFHFFLREPLEQIFERFGTFRAEAEALYDAAGNGDPFRVATYAYADTTFIEPARHIARLHAANGHPTWQFRFSYVPEHVRDERVGAIHSSDIQFVFGTIASFFTPTANDERATETMRAYWRSFIRDGVPDPDGPPAWPRFAAEDDVILDFRAEGPTVGPDPARERLDFIERIAESGRNDRYFDSAGVRIRYIDVGPRDGEPVVLVHGFTQDIETCWGDTGAINALDDDFRVIALDCRGHGKSDKPHDPEEYGVELAADVIRLLDHMDIERAHIAGYSMGGGITFTLLVHHPERVISAMPCGTGLRPPDAETQEFVEAMQAALDQEASTGSNPDQPDAEWPIEGAARQFAELVEQGADPVALAAVFRTLGDVVPDVSELEHNSVPSLSLFGEFDDVADITWTAERMANLDIEVIEGANHMTAFRHPAFVAAVTSFFSTHAAAIDDHYFDSDGVTIRYIDVGPRNGEPVVLIHGGFSSAEFWAQSGVIDALDDECRVIALDLRGHGKSDKPHEIEAYGNRVVEDVIRLLDHLAIDKAHVVGYSMGGRITYRLVADYLERVISAMPCGTDAEPLSSEFHDRLLETAALLETTGSNRPLIEHFNQDGMLTGEQVQEIVETLRATNDRQAMAAVLRAFPDFVPDRSRLEANTVPCLCVIGENDPNRAAAETTAGYMGRLEVVVLEGQNHMTTFQQPEFVAAVKSFLTRRGDTSKHDPEE